MNTSLREASISVTVAVIASAALSCHSRSIITCTTSDLTASFASDMAKSLETDLGAWIRNVRMCDMGDYIVATPAKSSEARIIVFRKGPPVRALFTDDHNSMGLFDPDRKRGLPLGLMVQVTRDTTLLPNVDGKKNTLLVTGDSITLNDPDKPRVLFEVTYRPSGRNHVSYSAFDPSQGAWIENLDDGPDGSVDLRFTEVPGRPVKTEFRVGERWLERVKREGQVGTILDGEFMSVAEARARLAVKADKPRGK